MAQNLVKSAEDLSIQTRDNAIYFDQASYELVARFGTVAMKISSNFYENTFGTINMAVDPNYPEIFGLVEVQRAVLRESPNEDFSEAQRLLPEEFRTLMRATGRLTIRSTGPIAACG